MIRPQYHFRPSPQGLLAWDVRRLITLSADFPVRDVPLDLIRELDENYWFEVEGSTPTCRAIIEHCTLMLAVEMRYPIILSQEGRVMDGMHRVCRAAMEGQATIRAVQFTQNPPPDYIGVPPEELPY